MPQLSQPMVKHRLLAQMTPGYYALLQPHRAAIELLRQEVLARVDCPISHLYFFETT